MCAIILDHAHLFKTTPILMSVGVVAMTMVTKCVVMASVCYIKFETTNEARKAAEAKADMR